MVRHLRKCFGAEAVILADNPAEVVVLGTALEYGRASEIGERNFRSEPDFRQDTIRPEREYGWQLVSAIGKTHNLSAGTTTIGRRRTNDVWLKDDLVSRVHAELRENGQGVEVVDMGSANGTFLNGKRLPPNQAYPLQAGDRLKIGQTEFTCIKNT
jgi:hypothetical protein